jgi:2,3-bisphosphoglycerate-dependent phosphoglycerate mutase
MSDLQCATRLIVARHGEAEYESPAWDNEGGWLSATGRTQARALAERFADQRVAHVYTSTLARAVQTGEIAAATLGGLHVTTREGLREFVVGDFSGSTEPDPFAPTYARWLAGELDARIPGGESGTELVDRMRMLLQEIADQFRGETVLVISHGGLIRLTLPLLLTAEPAQPPARLGNCAAVELAIDGDGWVCTAWPSTHP